MDDFVTPETKRLPLCGGMYVDIAKRLNHGETEDMYARMSPSGLAINRREVRTAKVLAYLIGWSLTKDGQPVPMSPQLPEQTRIDTIRALDPDRFQEIYTAIDAHEDAMDLERAEQKKILSGSLVAGPTSPLLSGAGGGSNGSENLVSTITTS